MYLQADPVVTYWVQPIKLNIKHMGQPCNRMPVSSMKACESPPYAFKCKTCLNMKIFCNIGFVIIVDKFMICYLPIYSERCSNKKQAYDNFLSFLVQKIIFYFAFIFHPAASFALQIRPKYLTALDNLGMTLHQLGRFEEALFYYSKALKIDPKHARIHNNTANVLTALGKLKEAIKHYRKAILITPDFAEPHYNLANILVIQKRFDEAVFHYESAIKNDSEYSDAHYNLGCILLRQKKFKEALVNFTQAVKINPDYKQAYNQIGIILLQRGKIKKAENFFSKAVQIDHGYKEAINNLLLIRKRCNYSATDSHR